MTTWQNWSGLVRAAPQSITAPTNEPELVEAVRAGIAPVRVAGSGHSFTPLCETSGSLLSLESHQGIIGTDPQALTAAIKAGTKIHAIGRPLFDLGFGLKNQGDIDRQSISGAIGTGTHGTGPTLGSLSSEVKAFRLVTAEGGVLECSPSSNAEIWEAGRVSFAALGVMSEITLNVRKAYKLRERIWLMPAADCWRDLSKLRDQHRHFEFFWFPFSDSVVAKSLDDTQDEVSAPLTSPQMHDRGERVSSDQRLFKFGCELARFVPSLSGPLQRLFTRGAMGASTRARWSHEIFPTARTVRFNEMEYAVPAANGADCIREIADVIRTQNIAGVFPIEFRFVKADDIWLSPFYKRDAVTISVHQYNRQNHLPLFHACETVFHRYGSRPHWGKLHTLKAADLEKLYPRWGAFRDLRRRLDPKSKLLNAHLTSLLGA